MNKDSELEAILAELEQLLYGYNYQIFLRVYHVAFSPGMATEWYVKQALGPNAEVGGIISVSRSEILAEIEQSLRYEGNSNSGPLPELLSSERFEELLKALMFELERAFLDAEIVDQFWVREGHPAYPVFWDFAFVVAGPFGGSVFIGSSSD